MFNPLQYVPDSVTSFVAPKVLQVQKHSPIILFSAGVVGAVTSTVLACKATLSLDTLLTDAQNKAYMLENLEPSEEYSEKTLEKAKTGLKIQTAVRIGKLYAPAIGVGVLSIGALTGSHYIMSQRQAGLLAAYAGLDRVYKEYQARVAEELGDERELQLRHGSIVEKVKGEDGKTVKVHRKDPNGYSQYAKLFSRDTSSEWLPNPEYNVLTLKAKQSHLNDRLRVRGHLFLNDVYEALGLEHTKEGQLVGWVYGVTGDNFVDLGIFHNDAPQIHDFMYGNEGAVWIDPNVDGVIIDLI